MFGLNAALLSPLSMQNTIWSPRRVPEAPQGTTRSLSSESPVIYVNFVVQPTPPTSDMYSPYHALFFSTTIFLLLLPVFCNSMTFQFNEIYPNFSEWSNFPIPNFATTTSLIGSVNKLVSTTSTPTSLNQFLYFYGGDLSPTKGRLFSYRNHSLLSVFNLAGTVSNITFGCQSDGYLFLNNFTYVNPSQATTSLYRIPSDGHVFTSFNGKIASFEECSLVLSLSLSLSLSRRVWLVDCTVHT